MHKLPARVLAHALLGAATLLPATLAVAGVPAVVHKATASIYAEPDFGSATLATLEKDVRGSHPNGAKKDAAAEVGKRIAEKAKAAGVEKVAFDRAGFAYHGRVKALAEAAREAGLQF